MSVCLSVCLCLCVSVCLSVCLCLSVCFDVENDVICCHVSVCLLFLYCSVVQDTSSFAHLRRDVSSAHDDMSDKMRGPFLGMSWKLTRI